MGPIAPLFSEILHSPKATFSRFLWNRFPKTAWNNLSHQSKDCGLDQLYFVLSLDCDTKEDAAVVLEMDEKLRALGCFPAYAVPGAFLESEADVYKELAERGAEFLNHGYRSHTRWDEKNNRYESCFFYDQQSPDVVKEDIEKGHAAIQSVLGITPIGFRTPHFGTFQKEEHLDFLYLVLRSLGYKYSSSTVPQNAFHRGSRYAVRGLYEFPVSGMYSSPLTIQDSWGFFSAPDRERTPEQYLEEAREFSEYASHRSLCGILNYYADPSHIWDKPLFYEAVKTWVQTAKPSRFTGVLPNERGMQ